MYIEPSDPSCSKRGSTLGSIGLYLCGLKSRFSGKDYIKVYRTSSENGTGRRLARLVGLIFLSTALHALMGALLGALVGEILDWIPYLNTVIPETLNAMFHTNYFTGNLDKFGATLGFISGLFKSGYPEPEEQEEGSKLLYIL
jgi:hypothetical protein